MAATGQRPTREQYLAYLVSVLNTFNVRLNTFEKVIGITNTGHSFVITTERTSHSNDSTRNVLQVESYLAKHVVLAIGDLHAPQRLGVLGEELPHVRHAFDEAFRFVGSTVMVVGGRHSALGAALRLAGLGCRVTLTYHRPELDEKRLKPWIFSDFTKCVEKGLISFLPDTQVIKIHSDHVDLLEISTQKTIDIRPVDAVLVLVGFRQDKSLFKKIGVSLVGEAQSPQHNPDNMETNVPSVFVAGTAVAGDQLDGAKQFIENSRDHSRRIVDSILSNTTERIVA